MTRVRCLFLALAASAASLSAGPRHVTCLDSDWRFHRGDILGVGFDLTNQNPPSTSGVLAMVYDDSSWQQVNLPHDYVVEGAFDPKAENQHACLPLEAGWYRKQLSIPSRGTGASAVAGVRRRLSRQPDVAEWAFPGPPRQWIHELSLRHHRGCETWRAQPTRRAGGPQGIRRLVVRGRWHLPARSVGLSRSHARRALGRACDCEGARSS